MLIVTFLMSFEMSFYLLKLDCHNFQVIRLRLSERCCSPGCAAVLNEAQKLGKKVKDMEALAIRLRNTCTAQQQG